MVLEQFYLIHSLKFVPNPSHCHSVCEITTELSGCQSLSNVLTALSENTHFFSSSRFLFYFFAIVVYPRTHSLDENVIKRNMREAEGMKERVKSKKNRTE